MTRHIPIAEWASLVHSRSNPWKIMIPLRAYFDESGLHATANVTVVAGFAGTKELWEDFERDWLAKLEEVGNLPYFHMTECVTGNGPVFGRWQSRPEIRGHIIKELADVICRHKPQSLWCAVETGAWDALDAPMFKERYRTPYHFCFEDVVQNGSAYATRVADGSPLALIFSNHSHYKKRANEVYEAYDGSTHWHLAGLTFADMRLCTPLQAPDMLAYELAKDLEIDWAPPEMQATLRPVLERLVAATNFPKDHVIFDLKGLEWAASELMRNTGAQSL